MAEEVIETVMTPLDLVHGAMMVSHIRKKMEEQTQEKNQNKGSVLINCTFRFNTEIDDFEVADWLLSRMAHNECGVRGEVTVGENGNHKCVVEFPYSENKEKKEFTFINLTEFIVKLVKSGVDGSLIASTASEICDDTTVKIGE